MNAWELRPGLSHSAAGLEPWLDYRGAYAAPAA